MVEWKKADSKNKLLAALVASLDQKLNYTLIAKYFGEGATYDAIENQFRPIRKQAEELRKKSESGETPEVPARCRNKKGGATRSSASTPRSVTSGISSNNSRVAKPMRNARGGGQRRAAPESSGLGAVIHGRVSKSQSKSVSPEDKYGENALKDFSEFEWSQQGGFEFGGDGAADSFFHDGLSGSGVFDDITGDLSYLSNFMA